MIPLQRRCLIPSEYAVRYFIDQRKSHTFEPDDYVDDVKETMSKIRHRDFPILDEQRHLVGMMSRQKLAQYEKETTDPCGS